MPAPRLPKPVIIAQGMKDMEAIQSIKTLNLKTGLAQVNVLELIELASYFSQPTVGLYIEYNKDNLSSIKEWLLMAQVTVEELKADKITSLAFASVLFGGSVWASLPKMFSSLDPAKLEDVLSLLRSLLQARFNLNLANWICASWKYLEEQTLSLLGFLKDQSQLEDTLIANTATISTMVQIEDVKEYLMIVNVFSEYQAFQIVLESIKSLAPRWKSEQKLSQNDFVLLVNFLITSKNKQLITANKEVLVELPLKQW